VMSGIALIEKRGGKSGTWLRKTPPATRRGRNQQQNVTY